MASKYVATGRPGGRYRTVDLVLQLEAVLEPWWEELSATPEQIAACWGVIDRIERESTRSAPARTSDGQDLP